MAQPRTIALGDAQWAFAAASTALDLARAPAAGLPPPELERRLIELGFVEGAPVEMLHQGLIGGDPIAVRVNETTIALRRREASRHLVEPARGERGERSRSADAFALVGNPNCGKTALFNALTGSRQKVANYPGVTVERRKRARHARRPPVAIARSARHIFVCERAARRGNHSRHRAGTVRRRGAARPARVRRRCQQSAAGAALRPRAEARRPADDPGAQHVGYRPAARRRYRPRRDCRANWACRWCRRSRSGAAAPTISWPHRYAIGAARAVGPPRRSGSEPDASELRGAQREADRILPRRSRRARPVDPTPRGSIAVVLHPVAGLVILLALLFVMFQAVFAWAQPPMELIESGLRRWLGALVDERRCPTACCAASSTDGADRRRRQRHRLPAADRDPVLLHPACSRTRLHGARRLPDGPASWAAPGLHGRAFIPLLSSFACAIPGIMATRVIETGATGSPRSWSRR